MMNDNWGGGGVTRLQASMVDSVQSDIICAMPVFADSSPNAPTGTKTMSTLEDYGLSTSPQ
jgi:hypothetical protein